MAITTPEIQQNRERVLDAILSHPEKHSQSYWGEQTECGTALCVAGWACQLDPESRLVWRGETSNSVALTDGSTQLIGERAQQLLGLDRTERRSLFTDFDNGSALTRLKHLVDTGELPPKEDN